MKIDAEIVDVGRFLLIYARFDEPDHAYTVLLAVSFTPSDSELPPTSVSLRPIQKHCLPSPPALPAPAPAICFIERLQQSE